MFVAVGVGELDGGEVGDGGAAHADAEHADGEAPRAGGYQPETSGTPTAKVVPPMPRKNPVMISAGYDDDERQRQHRHDGGQADEREHDPGAEPVGERADRDAAERADDDGHRDEQRLGGEAQAEAFLDARAERAEQRPRPEVHREPDGGQDQVAAWRRSGRGAGRGGGRVVGPLPSVFLGSGRSCRHCGRLRGRTQRRLRAPARREARRAFPAGTGGPQPGRVSRLR